MRNAGWRGEEAGKQGYASNPHIETCSLYKIDLKKNKRSCQNHAEIFLEKPELLYIDL